MAIIEGGVSTSLAEVGIGASLPMHTTQKPLPYGNLGHYRVVRRLTPAATTLAGILWSFRNPTGSGVLCVVKQVRLRLLQIAAPSAAIEDRFSLKVVRGFTVADTTNGTAFAATANMQELRTSMAANSATIREASAAAGITAGTGTADTEGIATGSVWVPVALQTASIQPSTEVFNFQPNTANGEHPLVLAADEGFRVSNDNNLGANQGIVLYLDIAWAEVTLY